MIHWLGAGLSSTPGIRRVAASSSALTVWNRTLSKARQAVAAAAGKDVAVRQFSMLDLSRVLAPGNIAVSMLPAAMHPEVAKLCLDAKAHLVTTSYISDPMAALHSEARRLNLSFVNEAGLDPGLDHLLARELVDRYRKSPQYSPEASLSFRSLCGGFPRDPGPFRYKFSWSPLGVLRALKNPARYIRNGIARTAPFPWKELFEFSYRDEAFEAYPNRDSLPYMKEYGFDPTWQATHFLRGTLRPKGWSAAWAKILEQVERGSEVELKNLSDDLWRNHRYQDGEQDRVLLFVELQASRENSLLWSKSFSVDEFGSGQHTAMARLVSLPAAFAVEAIGAGQAPAGVSGAPADREESRRWLRQLQDAGIEVRDESLKSERF